MTDNELQLIKTLFNERKTDSHIENKNIRDEISRSEQRTAQSFTEIKNDIADLRGFVEGYQKSNNEVLTKVRISVAKLATIAACSGIMGGVIDNKFTHYFKNEKQKIERSIKNGNNDNNKGE